jgi:hypothetical protein
LWCPISEIMGRKVKIPYPRFLMYILFLVETFPLTIPSPSISPLLCYP